MILILVKANDIEKQAQRHSVPISNNVWSQIGIAYCQHKALDIRIVLEIVFCCNEFHFCGATIGAEIECNVIAVLCGSLGK